MKKNTNKTNAAKAVETTAQAETAKPSPIGETPANGENKAKLKQCEDIIRQNENGVFITGRNLAQINKEELYKAAGFTAFAAYCKERWGMSGAHAYRLIDAAECYDALAKHETKEAWVLPRNEAQIRPLTKLGEKEWVPTWEKVMAKFGATAFTAEDISGLLNPGQPEAEANGEAGEEVATAKAVPAKKLKQKLEKLESLVSKALEDAPADKDISAKQYRKLLEKIKKMIEAIK